LRAVLLLVVVGSLVSCQSLREVANLKDVRFRIDRATDAELAGIRLADVRSYEDLGGADVARLAAAMSRGELPLSFTLQVEAENPPSNSVNARLTKMDWTLLLDENETISGVFDREVVLPPGEPTEVPLEIKLDLLEFFDQNLQGLADLATAVGGDGPPSNVQLRVRPTVRTPLGEMKYPTPITVVNEEVGGEEASSR
jgi:hypothetical protein